MFWLNIDLPTQTATLHKGDCIHADPKPTEFKGINEMKRDGGWFNFDSVGAAMRFFKTKRLSGEVHSCLFCKPLNQIANVTAASLDVKTPKTGCDACGTRVDVMDTKSTYKRLVDRFLGEK